MTADFRDFVQYLRFAGRATRTEYWAVILLSTLIAVLASFAIGIVSMPFGTLLEKAAESHEGSIGLKLGTTFLIIVFVSLSATVILLEIWVCLAVCVRRLHDSDFPAWFVLAIFIPLGGVILFIVAGVLGPHTPNRYGPDPRLKRKARSSTN